MEHSDNARDFETRWRLHAMKRLPLECMLLGLAALAQPAWATDTVYYYYTNTLHSAVVETDAQGNIVEQTTHYAPYGQVLNRSMRDGPGYTGHEEDPSTGLNYMQQRYYDPQSGRFVSTDPVFPTDDGGNFNRYWYAGNNPYRYTDPDGKFFGIDDIIGSVVGGLVGVGVEVVRSEWSGERLTTGDVAGAFVGGALLGEGVVNAPETLGGSVVLAGVARGAAVGLVSNSVQQTTDIASGVQKQYSVKSAVISTAVGGLTGGFGAKVGTLKVPGITSGRNNMAAVAKGVRTRIASGNASRMSLKTMIKGAVGGQVGDAGKTLLDATGKTVEQDAEQEQGEGVCSKANGSPGC